MLKVAYECTCPAGYIGSGIDLDESRAGGGETAGCLPDAASSSVDSCNDKDGIIEMTFTLRNYSGRSYPGIDPVTGKGVFTVDQLQPSFSDDGEFLYMDKVLGGTGCTEIVVDGVTVCKEVGETIILRCKYPLADQVLSDTYQVSGQDTDAVAENTGTLSYNLSVDQNSEIGDQITFTIDPVNSNLVYATIKECHVTKTVNNVKQELTIIGHGANYCTNPVVAAGITNFSEKGSLTGSWTAFKWSTATTDADAEDQGLSCTIGLSQNQVNDNVVKDCTLAN